MRAVRFDAYADDHELKVVDAPAPEPAPVKSWSRWWSRSSTSAHGTCRRGWASQVQPGTLVLTI